MAKQMTIAEYLDKAIDASGKNQREIAEEVGYPRPNVVSMIKKGVTKMPIGRIPAFAKALGVDPKVMLRIAMQEYQPEVWDAFSEVFGEVLSDEEMKLVTAYRKCTAEKPGVPIHGTAMLEIEETLRKL